LASGVLPILVGPATRFSEELTGGPKRYLATIRLGVTSATDDGEGPIQPGAAPVPGEAAIRIALARFVGTFEQRPPVFSARKVAGRAAYRAARSGEPVELSTRRVTVHTMDVLALQADDSWTDVSIDLRCGPGTYVRSIARDLGEALGCGGYLVALRRTEAAGLTVDAAVRPDDLEALAADGRQTEALLPNGELLPLPRLRLSDLDADRFRHGSRISLPAPEVTQDPADRRRAIFDASDRLLGIGSVVGNELQPEKVLAPQGAA
jgi:tRNA pseudouridine55 synthase